MKIERATFATAVMIDGSTHLSANPKNTKDITYDEGRMIYYITGIKGSRTLVHSTNVQYSIPHNEQATSVSSSKRTPKEA